jgi:hypothetical protein
VVIQSLTVERTTKEQADSRIFVMLVIVIRVPSNIRIICHGKTGPSDDGMAFFECFAAPMTKLPEI